MKLRKLLSVFIAALALSVSLAPAAYALDIVADDSYEWTESDDGIWSCEDEHGKPVKGFAVRITTDKDGKEIENIYYLDKEGNMKTGWVKNKGNWYYLDDETGTLVTDDWVDNYYVNDEGEMTKIR